MNARHKAARQYHESGLPITICRGKKPLGKGWQKKRWTIEEIDHAFKLRGDLNVGSRLGPDSGLIDLECDSTQAASDLKELFDDDVPVAPTWSSHRGAHRLFAWHDDLKKIGAASVHFGELEIRLGANGKGAQSLLPPSVTGDYTRQWKVPLDDCDPPPLPDGVLQRLLCEFSHSKYKNGSQIACKSETAAGNNRVNTETHHDLNNCVTCVPVSLCKPTPPFSITEAIRRTLPSGPGFRCKQIFEFARHLKAMPEYANSDAMTMLPVIQRWHSAALQYIGTKDFDTTFADFSSAWDDVKFPFGKGPLMEICNMALTKPLPTCSEKYRTIDSLCRTLLLCRELQRHHGDSPFFLDCRSAGDVLNISHVMAYKWLKLLINDGVLERVSIGKRNRASEYRYVGD